MNIEKEILIGYVNGKEFNSSHDCPVFLEIELKEINKKRKTIDLKEIDKYITLSICGSIKTHYNSSSYLIGRLIDDLRQYIKENKIRLKIDKDDLNKILDIWDKWDLHDLKPGTRKQIELLKKHNYEDYNEAREILKKHGILIDNGTEYGTVWLIEELPDEVVDFIKYFINKY